jgi:hypothetical protein
LRDAALDAPLLGLPKIEKNRKNSGRFGTHPENPGYVYLFY